MSTDSFRFVLILLSATLGLRAATEITSNGVTWTLAEARAHGVFVNGDPWVIGPVTVTAITNSLNDRAYTPKPGQNGSMVNPGTDQRQGYDSGLKNYDASLNASLPQGRPISPDNPLALRSGSSIVSTVSWLYNSAEDREPGAPKFNGATNTPRPILRSGAVLTILAEAPPADAFRPPYVGSDKSIKFLASRLDYSKLARLALPTGAQPPSFETLADGFARPWNDHVNGWMADWTHPSLNMPNYGRDIGRLVGDATLRLFTESANRGINPDKDRLVIGLVQYGLDCAGIADNDGGWPADGGHGLGRKWPILFAGALLKDTHLLDAGQWPTRFQENEQHFKVSLAEVELTNGPDWKPDKRATLVPYTEKDIGTPEWGIRHATYPQSDNAHFTATYREINGSVTPAFALAARAMGLKQAWNHDVFFDYADRFMTWRLTQPATHNNPSPLLIAMWNAHRPNLR